MSVGLLLITHDDIGDALLASATGILGLCPLRTQTLPVGPNDQPDQISDRAKRILDQLQLGKGVLILTDLLGSTPSNVAGSLQQADKVHVVTGLNLPMLIKVLSHPSPTLQRLTETAIEGGRLGVHHGLAQSIYPLTASG